ncbi:MAG TPA: hypothetical protein P5526_18280 [Anaerolineae bacterium]|nr:hypothetical protein [Anaerolineae bacterium]
MSDQPVVVLQANPHFVYDVAFSPDGRTLAAVGTGLSLRLWDTTRRQHPEPAEVRQAAPEEGEHDLFAVAFSPNGQKLACGGNHVIHLWDLQSINRRRPCGSTVRGSIPSPLVPMGQPWPAAALIAPSVCGT